MKADIENTTITGARVKNNFMCFSDDMVFRVDEDGVFRMERCFVIGLKEFAGLSTKLLKARRAEARRMTPEEVS